MKMYINFVAIYRSSQITYKKWRYFAVYEKNSTRKSGYNLYRGWRQTEYQNKHYNINQKDEET
jgi:hypothetical protein